MIKPGQTNHLRVVKLVDFGCYLDGGERGEILLPTRYMPENLQPEDYLDVFIYFDSEDRIIATTEKPNLQMGEIGPLKVISVTKAGAFLDWGLSKDLFVPFREQNQKMEVGKQYVVALYIDEKTDRLAASAKIEKFLDNIPPDYETGQEVELLIYHKSDVGYSAIINNTHKGLLYDNEIFQPLRIGKRVQGYIKKVREDDKIDLILHKPGHEGIDPMAREILDVLVKNDGFLPLTDKSDPEEIYGLLGISKKLFKKAIGGLYKEKKVVLKDDGIYLIP